MKKATLNYWVDLATGVALLLCAATGIIFLFPSLAHSYGSGAPTIFGIGTTLWHTVHDWSGMAMTAGVGLHLVLHAKWIANLTRRVAGLRRTTIAERGAARGRAAGPAAVPARIAAPAAAPAAARPCAPDLSPATADEAAAASLRRLEELRAERRREPKQRLTRKRFLAAAAAVGGVAVLAGLGDLGRDSASGAGTSLSDDGWVDSTKGPRSASTVSGARVVVDQSACVGCARCTQVCPAAAITLNG